MPNSPSFQPVPDVAEALDLPVTRVHQLVRDRSLLAVRRGSVLQIPADFIADRAVVKGLPATITLLTDAGYDDEEIIDWLFRPDASLVTGPAAANGPVTAMGELRAGRIREVHRRAQTAGF